MYMNSSANGIVITNDKCIIDGVEYELPNKNRNGRSLTTIDNKIYVDGYEFKDGKWKRTLMALWHLIF